MKNIKNIKKDFIILTIFLTLIFLIANISLSGYSAWFTPNITYPYFLNDDGIFSLIQKIIEGSIFENSRIAYPFGSNTKDILQPDGSNFLILKLISLFNSNWWAVHNLYYLLTFPIIFLTSYITFRFYKINYSFSILGSIAFTFLPFHFQRMHHLFLSNYAIVPLFWLITLKILNSEKISFKKFNIKKISLIAFILTLLGTQGIYYAFFGSILIISSGILVSLNNHNFKPIQLSILFIIPIIVGLLMHLIIPLIGSSNEASNINFLQRGIVESQLYAFTTPQLLSPSISHNLNFLSSIAQQISLNQLHVNENQTSSLGLIGSIGFLMSIALIFLKLSGRMIDFKITIISTLIFILFMFGLHGGFGSIFSYTVTPSIRAWNRISVFISFGSILLLFIYLNHTSSLLLNRFKTYRFKNKIYLLFIIVLASIIIVDQIPSKCRICSNAIDTKNEFLEKKLFFSKIENYLDSNSSVYQLPYMQYPEVPPLNKIRDYELFDGFLFTKNIRWSYGSIKNTEHDNFFNKLSEIPMEKKIEKLRKIGFEGIYLNNNGYTNDDIYYKLKKYLGKPLFKNESLKIYFFTLGKNEDFSFHDKTKIKDFLN